MKGIHVKPEKQERSSNSSDRTRSAFEELKAKLKQAAIQSEKGETVDGEEYLDKLVGQLQRRRQ